MAYRKETVMHVLNHNSPMLAHIKLLTQKRNISNIRTVIWFGDHLYMLYSFSVMPEGNERKKARKKEERTKEGNKVRKKERKKE